MAVAGVSLAQDICEELICPICLAFFTDPVSTDCGHNFCTTCIIGSWGDQCNKPFCPQCKEPIQPHSIRVNRKLDSLVEIHKKIKLLEAKRNVRAGGMCGKHLEPLKLFCRDQQALICMVCDGSKEHREHQVISLEEAAKEYKEKIQVQQPVLESEKERLVKQMEAEEQSNQECLKHIEKEKQTMASLFKEMRFILDRKECCWLIHLVDLQKEMMKRQEENMTRLCQEISCVSDLIKEAKVKCQHSPSEFMQDILGTLNRYQEVQMRQQLEPSPGLEWRLRKRYPKISVLKKAMEEFEESLTKAAAKVNVTLDPDTAHPLLVVGDNLLCVRRKDVPQNLPNNPERIAILPCVLGCDRFTSGRHWWEVEVKVEDMKGSEWWLVGVARESLRRKENFKISPEEGIWVVGRSLAKPGSLWAFATAGKVSLALPREPRKIWVFLDYEEGRVEFFNADTDDAIFMYPPASFSGEEIRPFFWVGQGICLKFESIGKSAES